MEMSTEYMEKSIVVTLTTVPERLLNEHEFGIKAVIRALCEQTDSDYEIHFNIPYVYSMTQTEYIIPNWLYEYQSQYPHLKIFRVEDVGPPTKFVPTIKRVKNPETIILTVDDDLIYHAEMVSEHRKYQNELIDSVICYEGRGSNPPYYEDLRDSWVLCVTKITETHSLQHYKSASYKAKLFTSDFFDYYFGRTFSDDVLVSRYFRDKGIKIYSVPYEPEVHLYATKELWEKNQRAETFPVITTAHSISNTGCNHPELLKIEPRFYEPNTLGKVDILTEPRHPVKTKESSIQINEPHNFVNLVKLLQPYNVNSPKLRIGKDNDGGYVVNELIVKNTKRLVCLGTGLEDSFEVDWMQKYPDTVLEMYTDYFPCNDVCHKNAEKINKTVFHINHTVGYDRQNIPLNVIIGGKEGVFLKADIEGDEYKIFDHIKLTDVVGMVIEFHNLESLNNAEKLSELIKNNFSELVLFHVHGNSWGSTFDLNVSKNPNRPIVIEGFPQTIELSFINKKLLDTYELDTGTFPDPAVDMSNNPDVPDIDLYWINAL